MAICFSFGIPGTYNKGSFTTSKQFKHSTNRNQHCSTYCFLRATTSVAFELSSHAITPLEPFITYGIAEYPKNIGLETSHIASDIMQAMLLADLDPATAKLAIPLLGPLLSAFSFLFILRIVMSWYPKLPVDKFPYVIAYAPTEPLLVQTRKVIPPLGGVDVTPVVWFGLISFLGEILVGPQGLLVLLSQQVS